jgi:DNA-binding MarR family transcriptional regulator
MLGSDAKTETPHDHHGEVVGRKQVPLSVQAITQALAIQGVSASEKLLLLVLANYAGPDDTCFPSHRRLAAEGCLSERTVVRLLQSLEDRGLIRREARTRHDGSRSTDLIALRLGGDMVSGGGDTMSGGTDTVSPRSCQDVRGVVSPCQGGTDTMSPLTTFEPLPEPLEEPSGEPPTAREGALGGVVDQPIAVVETKPKAPSKRKVAPTMAEVDAFTELWRIYPRRVAKEAAITAYIAASRAGADPDEVLAGARAYAAERAGKDPDKTAHASTWLNGKRWLDEASPNFTPSPQQRSRQPWSALDQAIEGLDFEYGDHR